MQASTFLRRIDRISAGHNLRASTTQAFFPASSRGPSARQIVAEKAHASAAVAAVMRLRMVGVITQERLHIAGDHFMRVDQSISQFQFGAERFISQVERPSSRLNDRKDARVPWPARYAHSLAASLRDFARRCPRQPIAITPPARCSVRYARAFPTRPRNRQPRW